MCAHAVCSTHMDCQVRETRCCTLGYGCGKCNHTSVLRAQNFFSMNVNNEDVKKEGHCKLGLKRELSDHAYVHSSCTMKAYSSF